MCLILFVMCLIIYTNPLDEIQIQKCFESEKLLPF